MLCTLKNSAAFKNNEKRSKELSVFGKNDSCCLSNFLQTHIFLNFYYISRTYQSN